MAFMEALAIPACICTDDKQNFVTTVPYLS
jgi:hypothetical protein